MKTTEVGKVTVSYNNGEVENIVFTTNILNNVNNTIHSSIDDNYKEIKDKLSSNDREKINEAAQYILANVFSKVTDLELRDFESSELESKVFCNEEDGIVTECTIVYYLIDKT